jgi:putative flippase GtrA
LLSMGINIYISGGFATIISALLSYALNAEWVFKEKRYGIN